MTLADALAEADVVAFDLVTDAFLDGLAPIDPADIVLDADLVTDLVFEAETDPEAEPVANMALFCLRLSSIRSSAGAATCSALMMGATWKAGSEPSSSSS